MSVAMISTLYIKGSSIPNYMEYNTLPGSLYMYKTENSTQTNNGGGGAEKCGWRQNKGFVEVLSSIFFYPNGDTAVCAAVPSPWYICIIPGVYYIYSRCCHHLLQSKCARAFRTSIGVCVIFRTIGIGEE